LARSCSEFSDRNAASRLPVFGERLNGGLARTVGDETIGALLDGKIRVVANAPPSLVLTDEDVRKRLSV